jgi:hypothetical protein
MPNINIEVTNDLLRSIRVICAQQGVRQREWVIAILTAAIQRPGLAEEAQSDVRDNGESDNAGTVREAQPGSPTNAEVVDESVQPDSGREVAVEEPWTKPKHGPNCRCYSCMSIKKK